MTAQKHLKERIRSRMKKTGESYAAARRQVLQIAAPPSADPALRWHFPGNVPASTALRTLLAHAGVRDPGAKKPFTEAMLFGLAGGIGIGVCSFYYEKGNVATFFVAGRHLWQDHVAYFDRILKRLGITPVIRETSGIRTAEQHLRDALQDGPCIAWVDGYRVITVYAIREDYALVGDLTDEPIKMALSDLAATRQRIKKQKNRLLSIPAFQSSARLEDLAREGIKQCRDGLVKKPKGMPGFFTLDAIRIWGERLYGSKDKQSWEAIFKPGPNLWRGLKSVYEYIEHYGTGGGLCRPLFADFLNEAAEAVGNPRLNGVSECYVELGRQWSALAEAALPDDVPPLAEAKRILAEKAESTAAGAAADARTCAERLEQQTSEPFPLSEERCASLRADLQSRVFALHQGEVAAQAALADAIG